MTPDQLDELEKQVALWVRDFPDFAVDIDPEKLKDLLSLARIGFCAAWLHAP